MEVILTDPLTGQVPPEWDKFVTETRAPSLWRSQLLALSSYCAQGPTIMAVVKGETQPVALFHGRLQGIQNVLRFVRPGAVPPVWVFECRLYPLADNGCLFHPTLGHAQRVQAVAAFERAIRRRMRWRPGAFCYRHLDPGTTQVLRRPTRITLAGSPELTLVNEWSSLADYLKALPGKWRKPLRKIQTKIRADATIRTALHDTVPSVQAARLASAVLSRHTRRGWVRPPIPVAYFDALNADPATRFATYYDGDTLLALSAVHDTGTDLAMSFWGSRDRTEGGRQNLYFDSYLTHIDLMIRTGRASLQMGKGMADVKARFGATPRPSYLVAGL